MIRNFARKKMRHRTTKYLLTLWGLIITLTASADVAININPTYSPEESFETQEYDRRFDASNNYFANAEMAPSKEDYSQMYLTIESLEDGNIIYWNASESSCIKTISASTILPSLSFKVTVSTLTESS